MECFNGVIVSLNSGKGNGVNTGDWSIKWTVPSENISGTTENMSEYETIYSENTINIPSSDLENCTPDSIEIQVVSGNEVILEKTLYGLNWETGVCNECSGGFNCHDDMYNVAHLNINYE